MSSSSRVPDPPRLSLPGGAEIAYRKTEGATPGIVFLGGFMSDMTGTKATALEARCRAEGRAFVRFDYSGHGASGGSFVDGTVGAWAAEAIAVIDRLTEGPQVLAGSSMGGWIMLLVARARPRRVAALVGIAPAPDFTEDLYWQRFDEAMRETLAREGLVHLPSEYGETPYPITRQLIDEARRHLVFPGPIEIACPVRLLHGMEDADVPWQTSLRLAGALATRDAILTLIKDGDHRLSRDCDIERLWRELAVVAGPRPG